MDKFHRVVDMWTELHPTFPNLFMVSDDEKYSSICRSAEDTEHWRGGLPVSTEVLSFLGDLF